MQKAGSRGFQQVAVAVMPWTSQKLQEELPVLVVACVLYEMQQWGHRRADQCVTAALMMQA